MKKTLRITTAVLLLLIGVTSCNNDDESARIDIPREPQHDEIKIIFKATSDNSEALFYISGNRFSIDWGDEKTSTSRDLSSNKSIKHSYEKNGEYVITIITDEKLEFFKNFSANSLSDFGEEEIPVYEKITIGQSVYIEHLYIQASGVKGIRIENPQSVERSNLLLGAVNWNLSMVDTKSLSVYMPYNYDLDIKNLVTEHLSVTIKDEINNLSISACENLTTLAIDTKFFTKATINNLSITSLPNLDDLRLYSLAGKNAILTDLPQLELTLLNAFYYETIDMTNTINSSVEMSLKAQGISASKSIKLSKQLSILDINNREFELATDIGAIDFSVCPQLKLVDINNLKKLHNLEFGSDNTKLDKVILKNVSSLNSLDFSQCENVEYVEVVYGTSLSNVKFSSNNQFLKDAKFQNTNFTESSCVDMINTLPNFSIPNIPTVNRRRLLIRNNNPSLKDNVAVVSAIKDLQPYWVSFID